MSENRSEYDLDFGPYLDEDNRSLFSRSDSFHLKDDTQESSDDDSNQSLGKREPEKMAEENQKQTSDLDQTSNDNAIDFLVGIFSRNVWLGKILAKISDPKVTEVVLKICEKQLTCFHDLCEKGAVTIPLEKSSFKPVNELIVDNLKNSSQRNDRIGRRIMSPIMQFIKNKFFAQSKCGPKSKVELLLSIKGGITQKWVKIANDFDNPDGDKLSKLMKQIFETIENEEQMVVNSILQKNEKCISKLLNKRLAEYPETCEAKVTYPLNQFQILEMISIIKDILNCRLVGKSYTGGSSRKKMSSASSLADTDCGI